MLLLKYTATTLFVFFHSIFSHVKAVQSTAAYEHIKNSLVKWLRVLTSSLLTLKAPITTAGDYIHKYFFIVFQRKLDLMLQVNPLLGRGFT